ncbi:MAG: IS66 family insertion sequence element accessory protein TnpB [Xanthomonadaceae bacterium]|nr:IS66 family insertion sequence element accessory protein TnpB [Xanthomonadaceae bacterium]
MIALNRRTRIYVCKEVTDMRASYDSLYSRVKEQLKLDPYSGHLFLFVNRTRTSCKVLYYDGTGFVILQKRLDRGNFSRVNPRYDEEVILTEAEFGLFFEGSNLEKRFIDSPIARKNIQKKAFLKKRELQETVVTI